MNKFIKINNLMLAFTSGMNFIAFVNDIIKESYGMAIWNFTLMVIAGYWAIGENNRINGNKAVVTEIKE